jgi:hypothetical protein
MARCPALGFPFGLRAYGHPSKYFIQKPTLRAPILRYALSRLQGRPAAEASAAAKLKVPRIPLLLGSLYGPVAFLLSGKEQTCLPLAQSERSPK